MEKHAGSLSRHGHGASYSGHAVLHDSTEAIRAMFESATDGITLTDLQGGIVAVNEVAARLYGYENREELIGRSVFDLIAASDQAREILRSAWKTGRSDVLACRLLTKGGGQYKAEINAVLLKDERGKPMGFAAFTRDVTESTRAGEERTCLLTQVQKQTLQTQQIVDTIPEAVLLLDAENKVVLTNPAAREFLARVANVHQGDTLASLGGHPLSRFQACPNDGSWHQITAEGRTFEIVARPAETAPESTGSVLVIRDVTQQQAMQERIRQQDRLVAIGQLASGIAHDFNNLLTAIQGYTALVLDQLVLSDAFRADLEEVKKAADRAAALTNQLLVFSRNEALQPEVLNLNAVITGMEKMLRRLIGETIELETVLHPSAGQVEADPGQIEQVIMNLSVNARDAMPRGGQITLETRNITVDKAYAQEQPQVPLGDYVVLAASDTGIGMTQETKSHLFETFFTTKEKGKGTGLGLSTVHSIVKQSGGHIQVDSEIDVGTTFRIYLPRVEKAVKQTQSAKSGTGPLRGEETVLLVEDEDTVRTLARRALERYGYRALEASRPTEAQRLCQQHKDTISLLITDVVMPEMGGKELAEKLTHCHPEMRVLYISGYTDDALAQHGVRVPGLAFLEKPFTPLELVCKVRQVLDAPAQGA